MVVVAVAVISVLMSVVCVLLGLKAEDLGGALIANVTTLRGL